MAAGARTTGEQAAGRQPNVRIEPRRVLAVILDTIMVLVLSEVVNRLVFPLRVGSPSFSAAHGKIIFDFVKPSIAVWPWGVFLTAVYFTVVEVAFGISPGKLVMRLRVTDRAGRRVSARGAVIRNLFRPVDFFPLLYIFGAVSVYLSPNRQRLGDRVANTLVASRDSVPDARLDRAGKWRGALICAGFVAVAGVICGLIAANGQNALALDRSSYTGLATYTYRATIQIPNAQVLQTVALSGPRSAGGLLTYGLQYSVREGKHLERCSGVVVLRFAGVFGPGWELDHFDTTCGGVKHVFK
jgi:uncharacterized RDD family membrane protein YckC